MFLLYKYNFWKHHQLIDYIIPYAEFNLNHCPLFKTELDDSLSIIKKYIIKKYWTIIKTNLDDNH